MSQDQWSKVDRYITDLFVPSDPVLESALDASAAAGLPAHNVSPSQGKLLLLLALVQKAQTILEIGTLGGYSTIWLARALPKDGHLISLEVDPICAEVARANIARAGLADLVEVRLGPALDTLARLVTEDRTPFDLIFIDADKRNNPNYLTWALKLSRPGTLIIADNVIRDGSVLDSASDDPSVQGIRRFNKLVAAETRLSATAIQTVGNKGYDGFALVLVTSD